MKMKKHTLKQLQATQSPQCKALIKFMRKDWITPAYALRSLWIYRLSSRILEIGKVYELEPKWIPLMNNKRIKAWRLVR